MKRIVITLTAAILTALPFTSGAQDNLGEELDKYVPLSQGICNDVNLPCVKAILKTTDFFYVVFGKDGKIVAITKMSPDGKEITVWGKLPLRTNEKEI